MIDVGLTKISTKGQIVIPNDLRNDFKTGEKLIVIKSDNRLIIKKASDLEGNLKEDLEFAKRTEEAWKRYEKGEFVSMDKDDFLTALKKW